MAPVHADVSQANASSLAEVEGRGNFISLTLTPFDKKHYLDLIRAR
jgi:hypothetical protein